VNFGRNPRSKADLLRTVLEESERAIIVDGIIEPVGNIEEAQAVLGEAGLYNLNRMERVSKGLDINIRTERNRGSYNTEDIIRDAKQFLNKMPSEGESIPSKEKIESQIRNLPKGMIVESGEHSESNDNLNSEVPKSEDYSIDNLKEQFGKIPSDIVVSSDEQGE